MIFKKIRKGHADWRNFLCSTPAMDYVFQKDAYEDQIDRAAENIRNADCVIILKRSITFLADIKRAVFKNVELL